MQITEIIDSLTNTDSFKGWVAELLEGLCSIDTSMQSTIATMRNRELLAFNRIEKELTHISLANTTIERRLISPEIENHNAFTPVHYAVNIDHGDQATATIYKNRHNMLFFIDNPQSENGRGTAINAHIDVVPPFFPPRREGNVIYGRGTADDKGNIVALLGALHILKELDLQKRISLRSNLTVMFVIDEEMGGNGSLDLAMNRDLKTRYDSLLILECTDNCIHPANRGAVYFKCRLEKTVTNDSDGNTGVPLLEAMIPVILSILNEGERIKSESDHPLFPHRPVQTCTGRLGPFGEHPSTICGMVQCTLKALDRDIDIRKIEAVIQRGVAHYIERYGDKTRDIDRETGLRKLDRHYDCKINNDASLLITVFGCTGHMGSLPANDAAITKLAFIGEELLREKERGNLHFNMELASHVDRKHLVFEGAQGFLPTHSLEEVKVRLRESFISGLKNSWIYRNHREFPVLEQEPVVRSITFEKLHNDAYACDPHSDTMKRALHAAEITGIKGLSEPVRGWDVSCDARLFAHEYNTLPVLTFGAGKLEHAHSDNEHVYLPELFTTIKFITLFILLETGSVIMV